MGARALTVALGFWLFLSAFLWPHGTAQLQNALAVGTLAVTAALARIGGVRWAGGLVAALGGWLIISSVLLRTNTPTFWNHVLVGFGLALFGLAPSLRQLRRRTPIGP